MARATLVTMAASSLTVAACTNERSVDLRQPSRLTAVP